MTYNIAVLMGGSSLEAEVSRNSAGQVAQALESKGHSVTLVELDEQCTPKLQELNPDVVFPALHGPPGEDGTVQGYLEMLGLPYVGSGVRGCALAMDKAVAKLVFSQHHFPVLPHVVVNTEDDLHLKATESRQSLGEAVVIKPLNQGSAIGITLLPNGGNLEAALGETLSHGACIVEPFLIGKEITVGVLEHGGQSLAHPVIEIRTAEGEWYDYTNRYQAGRSEHVIPPELSESCQAELAKIAVGAHHALGLRDLSRADFIVTDEEQIALLEVNALPGMTPTSLYPDGARHIGFEFAELVDHLVRTAASRRTES